MSKSEFMICSPKVGLFLAFSMLDHRKLTSPSPFPNLSFKCLFNLFKSFHSYFHTWDQFTKNFLLCFSKSLPKVHPTLPLVSSSNMYFTLQTKWSFQNANLIMSPDYVSCLKSFEIRVAFQIKIKILTTFPCVLHPWPPPIQTLSSSLTKLFPVP